jgi:hypothetical protein
VSSKGHVTRGKNSCSKKKKWFQTSRCHQKQGEKKIKTKRAKDLPAGQSPSFILFDMFQIAGFTFPIARTKDKISIGPLTTMFITFRPIFSSKFENKGKARFRIVKLGLVRSIVI